MMDTSTAIEGNDTSLWFIFTVSTLLVGSSVKCGYQYGVMTGSSVFVRDFYNQSHIDRHGSGMGGLRLEGVWTTTIGIFFVGNAAGMIAGTEGAKLFGRNRCLMYNNIISVIVSVLMACTRVIGSTELLVICRGLMGFSVGITMTIGPMYLKEVTPERLKDAISRLHYVFFVGGILFGQIMSFFVLHGKYLWPFALGFYAIFDVIQIVLLIFCPGSPVWYLQYSYQDEKGAGALRQLRGVEDVEREIHELREGFRWESRIVRSSVLEILSFQDPSGKMPLLTCILLQAGRQLSGINVLVFYSTEIFEYAGLTGGQIVVATLVWTVVYVAVTITEYFYQVSRFKRTHCLLISFGVLTASIAGLTVCLIFKESAKWLTWFCLVPICSVVVAFAFGPALTTFVVCSELWSRGKRRAAIYISHQASVWSDVVIQFTFPLLLISIGAYTFAIYAGSLLLIILFILLYVPETKDRRFVDISTGFETWKTMTNDTGFDEKLDHNADNYSEYPLNSTELT